MKHRSVLFCTVLLCLFSFFVGALSCSADASGILAYQSRTLSLRVSYEAGGIPIEAELTLDKGDAARDMHLTILSPEEAAGILFHRSKNTLTATREGHTIPLRDPTVATAPLAFFSIPTEATVADIQKNDDGTRNITLMSNGVVWKLYLPTNGDIPTRIERTEGDFFRAIDIHTQ